ncbi:MAG: hypothetical protein K0R85_396 [Devosia sp.]|jgi:P27 family predicted phage terminase small subunit|nr:hypothetical protein [Devosia sp.]
MTNITPIDGGDGMPPEPDWTQTYSDELDLALASETWGEITREMKAAGTVAVANGHAIQRLVNFRIIYEHSARDAAENGAVIRAPKTGVPQYNPHWIVSRQADDAMRALEGELGISPLRRGRVSKAAPRQRKARPSDEWLARPNPNKGS